MRLTRYLMGMPVTIEIVGARDSSLHEAAFGMLYEIDLRFSPYRDDSEVSQLNLAAAAAAPSADMAAVLALAERTRQETGGFFDIRRPDGRIDPSGIVKGWAIGRAADLILRDGADDFFVDAGGDIASRGNNAEGTPWRVGICNPFALDEIIKIVVPGGRGVATSGTYLRGQHIYNPHAPGADLNELVSLTVVAGDIVDADRFATAAFAMGEAGIHFIEEHDGLEGFAIDAAGLSISTSGFEDLVAP